MMGIPSLLVLSTVLGPRTVLSLSLGSGDKSVMQNKKTFYSNVTMMASFLQVIGRYYY